MADKSDITAQLVLDGLRRAMGEPDGCPLHGLKNAGLFPATVFGRSAAQRCKDERYLQVAPSEANGKKASQICTITEKGLAFLLTTLQTQVQEVLSAMPQPAPLTSRNGPHGWKTTSLEFLAEWPKARPNDDCPLPELYRHAQQAAPQITVGQFHDGLRQMHADEKIHLHPWTGPLSEIPQPAYALLVGHSLAYYASKKNGV